jgi:hypothetical protein
MKCMRIERASREREASRVRGWGAKGQASGEMSKNKNWKEMLGYN